MKSNNKPHGDFKVGWSLISENIVTLHNIGAWNIQTAQECTEEIERASSIFVESGQKWALFNDLREWELCPPDVTELFKEKMHYFCNKNLMWVAVIPNNSIQKMLSEKVADSNQLPNLSMRYFTDEDEALT